MLPRRSTTCFCIQVGASTLAFGSRTQTTLALSSAESEYYGMVSGAAEGIYIKGVLSFFGWAPRLVVKGDSSAGIAVASRRGVGKLRTLDLRTLWLQERVAQKEVTLGKVHGLKNVADLGTKVLAGPRLRMLSGLAGIMVCRKGSSPEVLADSGA